MSRLQGGDLQAFELLYSRHARRLLNFFFQMCFDRVASEDYVQETFLRVWRARHSYRPVGKVSTWLFQIAKNYWLNERAKRALRPFHSVAGGEAGQEGMAALPDGSGAASPEALAAGREVAAAIAAAVGDLSEKLRLVFVMARYQNMPYAEIAQALEIPEGTVKSRMALAEKMLRTALRAHLEE